MRFTIDRIDHVVLTCADLEITAAWYQRVLGMEREDFDAAGSLPGSPPRVALRFAAQKLNLQQAGKEFRPHASVAKPGSLDICYITTVGPMEVVNHLHDCGVTVEEGPVQRTGALGTMVSVYCRDPDGNLVEISSYMEP